MKSEQPYLGRRLLLVKSAAYICLGMLVFRLWHLQGLNGSYYRDLSENNRTRTIRTPAPRGAILDREQRVLVRNRPAFDIAMMLEDTPDVEKSIEALARITQRDEVKLKAEFEKRRRGRPFEPKVVISDVSREELARIKVNSHMLPGVIVRPLPTRTYQFNKLAAHLFGYVHQINKSQLESVWGRRYKMGDLIGQTGLEKRYEKDLHGQAGFIQVEVDAKGNRRGELGIVDNKPGNDLYLTIDADVQKAAQDALGEHRGAVVAIDPRNGEIIALASGPAFDANIFSGQVLIKDWESVTKNPDRPLRNRAISSVYPPGSVLKLLWAVAGLSEGVVTSDTQFNCPGYYKLGRRRYHCHKRSGHGMVNLETAITLSCNVYFYQLGRALGISKMHKYMQMFGLGGATTVELPGEEKGTLPSEQWKLDRYGERWYPGDTLPVAIGQGYIVVTPLQMAQMMAAIANGGKIYRPLLVRTIVDHETGEVKNFLPELVRKLPIDPSVFKNVRQYAQSVVSHVRGTGKRAAIEGVAVGGKTGTAQVARLSRANRDERTKHHAWFVSFAPAENPTIALAVIVENVGGGGVFAAPVSQQVMEAYFRKRGMLPVPGDSSAEEPSSVVRRAALSNSLAGSSLDAEEPRG